MYLLDLTKSSISVFFNRGFQIFLSFEKKSKVILREKQLEFIKYELFFILINILTFRYYNNLLNNNL